MARKTYHHLTIGDSVEVVFARWVDICNQEERARCTGTVMKVTERHVFIDIPQFPVPGGVRFSRQVGQEWGTCDEGWQISPAHAQRKA